MMYGVLWTFERKNLIPIVSVRAETDLIEAERFILYSVVDFINTVSTKFDAKPYECIPNFKPVSNLTISFSLIFPDESSLKKFMDYTQIF